MIFLVFIATAHEAITTIAVATETSAALLNSGKVGLGDVFVLEEADVVGVGEEDALEES